MSRYLDPRAPVEFTASQVNELKTQPAIVKYQQLRDSLARNLRDVFGTIKKRERNEVPRYVPEGWGSTQESKDKPAKDWH